MRNYFYLPAALLLAACGGGGGSSTETPDGGPIADGSSASVLRTFGDDAGVVRLNVAENGEEYTFAAMTPEARTVAAEVNNGSVDFDSDPDIQNESVTGSNEYGTFYRGDINVNGTQVRGVAYEDKDSNVAIVYAESDRTNLLLAGGEKPTNLPAGTYTYRGTNVIGVRDGSYMQDGTFEMEVDFSNGTAEIDAQTPDTANGSGNGTDFITPGTYMTGSNIRVDNTDGTFSSTNVRIGERGGPETEGSLYGSFHGEAAEGVTGIYHDNANTPSVAGAIAGNR